MLLRKRVKPAYWSVVRAWVAKRVTACPAIPDVRAFKYLKKYEKKSCLSGEHGLQRHEEEFATRKKVANWNSAREIAFK
jgi:hypothetical protein